MFQNIDSNERMWVRWTLDIGHPIRNSVSKYFKIKFWIRPSNYFLMNASHEGRLHATKGHISLSIIVGKGRCWGWQELKPLKEKVIDQ